MSRVSGVGAVNLRQMPEPEPSAGCRSVATRSVYSRHWPGVAPGPGCQVGFTDPGEQIHRGYELRMSLLKLVSLSVVLSNLVGMTGIIRAH